MAGRVAGRGGDAKSPGPRSGRRRAIGSGGGRVPGGAFGFQMFVGSAIGLATMCITIIIAIHVISYVRRSAIAQVLPFNLLCFHLSASEAHVPDAAQKCLIVIMCWSACEV